jgi:hypothetical protein
VKKVTNASWYRFWSDPLLLLTYRTVAHNVRHIHRTTWGNPVVSTAELVSSWRTLCSPYSISRSWWSALIR